MRKFVILFLLFLGIAINGISQSTESQRYMDKMMAEAVSHGREIGEEIKRESEFAMSSTNEYIYVLYSNGEPFTIFSSETNCIFRMNNFKLELERFFNDAVRRAPRNIAKPKSGEIQRAVNQAYDNMRLSYRKEKNPNYRTPTLRTQTSPIEPFNYPNKPMDRDIGSNNGNDRIVKPSHNVESQQSFFGSSSKEEKEIWKEKGILESLTVSVDDKNRTNEKGLQDLLVVSINNTSLNDLSDIGRNTTKSSDIEDIYASAVEISNEMPQVTVSGSGSIPTINNSTSTKNRLEESLIVTTSQNTNYTYLKNSNEGITINSTVNTQQDFPTLESFDVEKHMEISGFQSQMQLAIAELNRIERFCTAYPSDCEYYQQRWKDANSNLEEAKVKLIALKQSEYKMEYDKYQQELEFCIQQQSTQNEFWGRQTQQHINYLNEKMAEMDTKFKEVVVDINNRENYIKERNSQISWGDKAEEVGNERLRRIDEQLINGEISSTKAALMKADAYKDIANVKTVHAGTNVYKKIEMIPEIVQEKMQYYKEEIIEEAAVWKDMFMGTYDHDQSVKDPSLRVIDTAYETLSPWDPTGVSGYMSKNIQALLNKEPVNSTAIFGERVVDKVIEFTPMGKVKEYFDKGDALRNLPDNVRRAKNKDIPDWYNGVVRNRLQDGSRYNSK